MSWKYIITFEDNSPSLCHSVYIRWWDRFHSNINLNKLPLLLRPSRSEISKITTPPDHIPSSTPVFSTICTTQNYTATPSVSSSDISLSSPLEEHTKKENHSFTISSGFLFFIFIAMKNSYL